MFEIMDNSKFKQRTGSVYYSNILELNWKAKITVHKHCATKIQKLCNHPREIGMNSIFQHLKNDIKPTSMGILLKRNTLLYFKYHDSGSGNTFLNCLIMILTFQYNLVRIVISKRWNKGFFRFPNWNYVTWHLVSYVIRNGKLGSQNQHAEQIGSFWIVDKSINVMSCSRKNIGARLVGRRQMSWLRNMRKWTGIHETEKLSKDKTSTFRKPSIWRRKRGWI